MGLSSQFFIPRQDILATVRGYIPIQDGYVGDLVFPPLSVFTTGGKRPFAKFQGDLAAGSATTGRTAGGAVTAQNNLANLVNFSCTERLARPAIDISEEEQYGGKTGVDLALGAAGIRQISDSIEADVVTAVSALTGVDCTTGGTLLKNLRTAVQSLKSYGQVAIVGGGPALNVIRNDSGVTTAMKATGAPIMPLEEVRHLGNVMIAAVLGADKVFEATGLAAAAWPTDHVGIIVAVNKSYDSLWFPQFGRRLVYTWTADGVNESMVVQETAITQNRQYALDFTVKDNIITANAGAGVYAKIA